MPGIPATFLRVLSNNATSKSLLPRRQAVMRNIGFEIAKKAMSIHFFPTITIPANRVYLRFVPEKANYLNNYRDVFSFPPDIKDSEHGRSTGGYSTSNRFTGELANGSRGLNGSYWGTPMGVAGEDCHYSLWKNYDGSGAPRLMAKHGYMVVQRAANALKYGTEEEVPKQLIYSGSCATNIIVARTIRPISCLNFNLSDPKVQEFLKKIERTFEPIMDALEFPSITQAIEDSEFREFARNLAYGASQNINAEGISVRSSRIEEAQTLQGFEKESSNNLVLLGNANQVMTDRLVGCGVIQIRSSAEFGVQATAVPIHGSQSPYVDSQPKELMIIPNPKRSGSGEK